MPPKNNPKVKDSNGLGLVWFYGTSKPFLACQCPWKNIWLPLNSCLCNWLPLNSCPLQLATSE